jgi:biotin carboxylase
MYEVVTSLGVPTPRTCDLDDERSISNAVEELGLPIVIRGTQGLAGSQVRISDDAPGALHAFQELVRVSPGAPFAQQYVPGTRCLVGGLFHRGRMLQSFSQSTIEAISPTGRSLRVRSVLDDRLTDYAVKIFQKLAWTGLACAEFIRTEAGDYHFLEINPRVLAAILASHRCGVPLMSSFAEYLLGSRPDSRVQIDGMEVTLFPQFILARTREKKLFRWTDRRAYVQAVLDAPWRYPRLLFHFAMMTWRVRGS